MRRQPSETRKRRKKEGGFTVWPCGRDRERTGRAGRAAILELLPFSLAELWSREALTPDTFLEPAHPIPEPKGLDLYQTLFKGFLPWIHDLDLDAPVWLDGYVRTYVERDVRQVAGIGDLDAFTRFVRLCAGRVGSILNASSLGADAGVTHVTAKRWISILRGRRKLRAKGPPCPPLVDLFMTYAGPRASLPPA